MKTIPDGERRRQTFVGTAQQGEWIYQRERVSLGLARRDYRPQASPRW